MYETNLRNIEEAAVRELARLMPEKAARKSVGLIIRQAAREDGLSGCAASRKGEAALTIARLVRGLSRINSYRTLVLWEERGAQFNWNISESALFGLILRRIASEGDIKEFTAEPEPYFRQEILITSEKANEGQMRVHRAQV